MLDAVEVKRACAALGQPGWKGHSQPFYPVKQAGRTSLDPQASHRGLDCTQGFMWHDPHLAHAPLASWLMHLSGRASLIHEGCEEGFLAPRS